MVRFQQGFDKAVVAARKELSAIANLGQQKVGILLLARRINQKLYQQNYCNFGLSDEQEKFNREYLYKLKRSVCSNLNIFLKLILKVYVKIDEQFCEQVLRFYMPFLVLELDKLHILMVLYGRRRATYLVASNMKIYASKVQAF